MKRSSYLAVGVGLAGALGVSTILKDKNKREQFMKMYDNSKNKIASLFMKGQEGEPKDLIEKAGHPDPYDIPDNKMVDEGAMTSVQYHNKVKE